MSQAATRPTAPPMGGCVRLSGVDWRTYTRLLHVLAEQRRLRLTFDRGELEIMSPTLEHDFDGRLLGQLVFILAEEFGLALQAGGSVTMKRRRRQRGIEADECFWIASAARIAGRRRLDLRTDPPPDLAIEVNVTRSSMNRLSIYAALRVPEVWRLAGEVLTVHVLQPNHRYAIAGASQSFPLITPADLLPFIRASRQAANQLDVLRQFRHWVQQQRMQQGDPTAQP